MNADIPTAQRPHYVYRLFDANDRLLYIGCTRNFSTRLAHLLAMCNVGKSPNGELIRIGVIRHSLEEYPNRRAALDAERAAIRSEAPLLNIQSRAAA